MLSMPHAGVLRAPHRHRHENHVPLAVSVFLHWLVIFALQHLACRRVKSIFFGCLAARAKCTVQKCKKTRIRLEGLWTLKFGRE